jgi:hypothetical protein
MGIRNMDDRRLAAAILFRTHEDGRIKQTVLSGMSLRQRLIDRHCRSNAQQPALDGKDHDENIRDERDAARNRRPSP